MAEVVDVAMGRGQRRGHGLTRIPATRQIRKFCAPATHSEIMPPGPRGFGREDARTRYE